MPIPLRTSEGFTLPSIFGVKGGVLYDTVSHDVVEGGRMVTGYSEKVQVVAAKELVMVEGVRWVGQGIEQTVPVHVA